ncbi:hypothetical protein PM082_021646 [Marasmius tenuissimus]|nr:hypothetical protein PM082_021646 [Marasmius tenuissimus]
MLPPIHRLNRSWCPPLECSARYGDEGADMLVLLGPNSKNTSGLGLWTRTVSCQVVFSQFDPEKRLGLEKDPVLGGILETPPPNHCLFSKTPEHSEFGVDPHLQRRRLVRLMAGCERLGLAPW